MNTKKYFITLFSFIIFSIYFTLSGVFVPFIASIPQSNGGFKTLSSQNDFYKMVDNFYDPDEFYNFRTDNQNINILANFYNTLNASSNFDVLTSFNQAIAVDDFNGDQRFYYNSDEFIDNSQSPTINIKALQLNQKAYDFYWNNNLGFNISDKLSFFIKIPSCFLKSSAIDSREKGAIK